MCQYTPCSSEVKGGQDQVLRHCESEDVKCKSLAAISLGVQPAEDHPHSTDDGCCFAIEEERKEEHADDETRLQGHGWKKGDRQSN